MLISKYKFIKTKKVEIEMDAEKELASIGRANEQLFTDQTEIDKRVMASDEGAVQESSDNLAAAKDLNKYHGDDLEQIARKEMDGEAETAVAIDEELVKKQEQLLQEHKDLAEDAISNASKLQSATESWQATDKKADKLYDESFDSTLEAGKALVAIPLMGVAKIEGMGVTHLLDKDDKITNQYNANIEVSKDFSKENTEGLSTIAKQEMDSKA